MFEELSNEVFTKWVPELERLLKGHIVSTALLMLILSAGVIVFAIQHNTILNVPSGLTLAIALYMAYFAYSFYQTTGNLLTNLKESLQGSPSSK